MSLNVTPAVSPSTGQTILRLQRFGFHHQTALIELTFNISLDPTRAQNPANYILQGVGRHGRFFAISAAIYDPIGHTVTLVPADRLLALRASYRLTVIGTGPLGVTDSTGALLDGLNNNKPGSNYVKVFSQHHLSGPSRIFTLPTTLADLRECQAFSARLPLPSMPCVDTVTRPRPPPDPRRSWLFRTFHRLGSALPTRGNPERHGNEIFRNGW